MYMNEDYDFKQTIRKAVTWFLAGFSASWVAGAPDASITTGLITGFIAGAVNIVKNAVVS